MTGLANWQEADGLMYRIAADVTDAGTLTVRLERNVGGANDWAGVYQGSGGFDPPGGPPPPLCVPTVDPPYSASLARWAAGARFYTAMAARESALAARRAERAELQKAALTAAVIDRARAVVTEAVGDEQAHINQEVQDNAQ